MTAQMKGFNAFFQETGASKLANADRGCLLDGPSLYHPTTQIFWLALPLIPQARQDRRDCANAITLPNMNLNAGHGWRPHEYYMSGQSRKDSGAGSSGEAAEVPQRQGSLGPTLRAYFRVVSGFRFRGWCGQPNFLRRSPFSTPLSPSRPKQKN